MDDWNEMAKWKPRRAQCNNGKNKPSGGHWQIRRKCGSAKLFNHIFEFPAKACAKVTSIESVAFIEQQKQRSPCPRQSTSP